MKEPKALGFGGFGGLEDRTGGGWKMCRLAAKCGTLNNLKAAEQWLSGRIAEWRK